MLGSRAGTADRLVLAFREPLATGHGDEAIERQLHQPCRDDRRHVTLSAAHLASVFSSPRI